MRGTENQNAVGNLVLHLNGNVRQWILSGVGGAPNTRVRDEEFAARSVQGAEALGRLLRGTVDEALVIIRSLPQERLMERTTIQGHDVTVLEAIFHVVEHFSGHTSQIIFVTKMWTGEDLGFYSYLSKPQTHSGNHSVNAESILFALLLAPLMAQDSVRYELRFPNAAHHETEVRATFSGVRSRVLELVMSRSSPGRYALHEFAKNIYNVRATDGASKRLRVTPSRIPISGMWKLQARRW